MGRALTVIFSWQALCAFSVLATSCAAQPEPSSEPVIPEIPSATAPDSPRPPVPITPKAQELRAEAQELRAEAIDSSQEIVCFKNAPDRFFYVTQGDGSATILVTLEDKDKKLTAAYLINQATNDLNLKSGTYGGEGPIMMLPELVLRDIPKIGEIGSGLSDQKTMHAFGSKILGLASDCRELLSGKRLVGYGPPKKTYPDKAAIQKYRKEIETVFESVMLSLTPVEPTPALDPTAPGTDRGPAP